MIATTVCDDGDPLPRVAVVLVPSLLLRRVTLSGVFVLALVLLWAAVLLPSLLRRHDVALARSAERLSSAMRVLQRPPRRPSPGPGPGAAANPVDLPERVDAAAVVEGPTAEPREAERSDERVPVLSPSARAARRRRRVLVALVGLTALGVVLGLALGPVGWVVAGTGAAALVAFLEAARRAVRSSARPAASSRRASEADPAGETALPSPDRSPLRAAEPVLFDQAAFDLEPVVEPVATPAYPAYPDEPALPPAAARPEREADLPAVTVPAPRRRRHAVAADGTWTPVPIPTPMYLTAPRVPYPSTPRRPVPAARTRQAQAARQRTAAVTFGVRRAVGS